MFISKQEKSLIEVRLALVESQINSMFEIINRLNTENHEQKKLFEVRVQKGVERKEKARKYAKTYYAKKREEALAIIATEAQV